MTIWRPRLAARGGPKSRQIADAIRDDIANGRLPPETRLPAQRDLAYALGVSLNTVTRAYADAADRGFVRGEVGRGTFVRARGALAGSLAQADLTRPLRGPIDFSRNLPAPGPAAQALGRTLTELATDERLADLVDYQATENQMDHRAAAVTWLSRLGLRASEDQITVTNGAQNGLLASLMATMRSGDVLLTDDVTYAPIKAMAHHLGLRIVPVAGDGGGLSAEALDAACSHVSARVLYCLPTVHTPTTTTMDERRRTAVVEVARKHDLTVIEDDVFGSLPPQRPPSIASLAPERTIYVTSVSKSMAPGLRVGYVHAPPDVVPAIERAVNLSCWMPAPLMVEIASRWIMDGTVATLNDVQRDEARHRQSMARELIPEACLKADPHGLHAWLTLPESWCADLFRMEAERRGVKIVSGSAFAIDPKTSPRAVRLCLSHEGSRDRVRTGLETIAALLATSGDGGSLII